MLKEGVRRGIFWRNPYKEALRGIKIQVYVTLSILYKSFNLSSLFIMHKVITM
jgi:hypothetical protein